MKILHIMDMSHPMIKGYAIRARYLCEAQLGFGHEVSVLTAPSQEEGRDDEGSLNGVTYFRSHCNPLERKLSRLGVRQLVYARALRRRLRQLTVEHGYDLIHAHTPFTLALPALNVARAQGLPFVYEKRNLWEESARARGKLMGRWPFAQLSRMIDRHVSRRADAVCTITEALKMHTMRMGIVEDRVIVVGNGVDTDAFHPQVRPEDTRRELLQDGDFVIGFLGQFFKFEGLPLLVEAFAKLTEHYPMARLALVGYGEDKDRVENLVRELGIDAVCRRTGKVPHEKVRKYYAAMDVLVYPRLKSTLTEMISPLKPLEPMAMGKPVVASDVGGLRELVEPGKSGFLFDAGSVSALCATLRQFLDGTVDTETLGRQARQFTVENRQWKHQAAKYEKAYEIAGSIQRLPARVTE